MNVLGISHSVRTNPVLQVLAKSWLKINLTLVLDPCYDICMLISMYLSIHN